MRHLLLPACLFVCAWAQPANPVFEFKSASADNTSVVSKTTPNRAETVGSAPAETTDEAFSLGNEVIDGLAADSAGSFSAFDEVGFNMATFEIPVPYARPVPMPPRRAIPHQLVCEALADAAIDNDLPTPFLIRLIWQESRFRQNAVSPVGAQGVAQFMPETAARMQLADPFNPLQAVRASAELLRDLFKQFGNLGLAAAAYNAGPKRVQDWLAKRGGLPQETRDYVQRITGTAAESWKGKQVAMHLRVPAQVPCQREAGLFAANGPTEIPLPPVQKTVATIEAKAETKAEAKADSKPAMKTAAKAHAKAEKTVRVASADDGMMTAKITVKNNTAEPKKAAAKAPKTDKKAPAKTAAEKKPAAKLAAAKAAPAATHDTKPAVTKTASARSKPAKTKSVKVADAHK
jgi:soluble lytic murein transglycosylase-like protein